MNTKLSPEERLKGLETWIWSDYMQINPDSAFALVDEFQRFAKKHNLKNQEAKGVHMKGVTRYFVGDYDQSMKYYEEALALRRKLNDIEGISSTINNMAIIYGLKGEINKAIAMYEESLALSLQIGDSIGIGLSYSNLAEKWHESGENEKAMDCLEKGLEIFKRIDSHEGISRILLKMAGIEMDRGNYKKGIPLVEKALKNAKTNGDIFNEAMSLDLLGVMYGQIGESEKALMQFKESEKIYNKAKNYQGLIIVYSNVAGIYIQTGDFVKSKENYRKALDLLKDIPDARAESAACNGLAMIFFYNNEFDSAQYYVDRAISIRVSIDDFHGLVNSYNLLVDIESSLGNNKKAIQFGMKALEFARKSEYMIGERDAAEKMHRLFKLSGDFDNALKMHELFITLRDSINKEENQKEIIRQEYQFAFEKQSAADSIRRSEEKKLEAAKYEASIKQEETRRFALIVILALVVAFSLFLFNRFRIIRRQRDLITLKELETAEQKDLLAHQKETLEEKQKEIIDSINYAKRIQTAILPPDGLFRETLPNSFVLYLPKDIVAGDFYWMETANFDYEQPSVSGAMSTILVAAADCTGHGVPGALVSVVCNNSLNRAVREFGLTDPGKILDKTREIVIAEFEKSADEVKDGMDISLAALNINMENGVGASHGIPLQNVSNFKLRWAGANNPLWVIRNDSHEVVEIKADKQPIGKYSDASSFTTHNLELIKGDTIYLFTDGFQDQFGGEKGKKYKSSRLKEFLLEIKHLKIEEQKSALENEITSWRGATEQIDDICIIGIRI